MSRVHSFAVAFNYNILNYLRLNYLRFIYAQFWRHFLTAFLFFLVLGFIIIYIIIFLFRTATANLIAYFPLKPMGICFIHYWPALPCFSLWVTAISFVISAHIDDCEAIQMCTKQPVNKHLLHYQLSKLSYNISTGIPIAC